jgi:hypothetical protein
MTVNHHVTPGIFLESYEMRRTVSEVLQQNCCSFVRVLERLILYLDGR